MANVRGFIKDISGDAIVEAAILFPLIIMIFGGMVLLSAYLPIKSSLQRATQQAATAIATEKSDTWLFYDDAAMRYVWETQRSHLTNVYLAMGTDSGYLLDKSERIVANVEKKAFGANFGSLSVECSIVNNLLYMEVLVTAIKTIPVPSIMPLVGLPKSIAITVTSTAVVQNADEFIRNIDLGSGLVRFITNGSNKTDVFSNISPSVSRVTKLLGFTS